LIEQRTLAVGELERVIDCERFCLQLVVDGKFGVAQIPRLTIGPRSFQLR